MNIISIAHSYEFNEGMKIKDIIFGEQDDKIIEILNNELLNNYSNISIDESTIIKLKNYIFYNFGFREKQNNNKRDILHCIHIITDQKYQYISNIIENISKSIVNLNLFAIINDLIKTLYHTLLMGNDNISIKYDNKNILLSNISKNQKEFRGFFQ